ncbi:hypothetical protein AAG570_005322 [Ranatra chinensis]|uniref:Uncharacterized protein n=1 Tax=Ranatra chinensis TaxID=642074 RepID=A0ABD0YCT4_9HEMI
MYSTLLEHSRFWAGNPRRGWPLSGQCPNENRLDKKASRSLELVLRRVIRERSRSRSVTYSSTKGPNRAKIVREFMRAMFKKHNGLTAIELIGEPPAGFPGQDQFRDEVGRSFDLEIELALRRRHQASDEGQTPVPGSGNGVTQASGTLRPDPTREQDDPGDEGEDREGGAEDENGGPDEEQKTADQQSSDGVTLESSESVMKKSCPEDSTPVWTGSTISIDLSHPSTSSLPLKVDKRQDSMMGIREPEEEEGDTQCYYPAKEVSSDEWSTYLGDNDSMECQELEVDCELVLDQDVTTSDVVTPAENESASRQETTPQSRIYREEDRKWLRYQVEIMSREECIIYCLIGHLEKEISTESKPFSQKFTSMLHHDLNISTVRLTPPDLNDTIPKLENHTNPLADDLFNLPVKGRWPWDLEGYAATVIGCIWTASLLLTLEEMPGTRALVPTADEARQALLKLTVGSHWDVMNLSELMQYSEKVEWCCRTSPIAIYDLNITAEDSGVDRGVPSWKRLEGESASRVRCLFLKAVGLDRIQSSQPETLRTHPGQSQTTLFPPITISPQSSKVGGVSAGYSQKAIEIIGTYHSLDYSSESRYRLNRMLMSFVEFRIPDIYESWD